MVKSILELVQLRHEEERCEEAEARVKELEKQVFAVPHGVTECQRLGFIWLRASYFVGIFALHLIVDPSI